ncbi:hypothetical protein J6590_075198 [Homalodisca vitripennis]|nr:hypothetical protein J6590_075198 [Homalodisca vitripennis]
MTYRDTTGNTGVLFVLLASVQIDPQHRLTPPGPATRIKDSLTTKNSVAPPHTSWSCYIAFNKNMKESLTTKNSVAPPQTSWSCHIAFNTNMKDSLTIKNSAAPPHTSP